VWLGTSDSSVRLALELFSRDCVGFSLCGPLSSFLPHDQLPCHLDVVVASVCADGRVFWSRVVASVIGYGAGVGSCSKQDFAFRSPM
jgi:hypothetical protein